MALTLKQLQKGLRDVEAPHAYLNAAYAELNAALIARNFDAVEGIRLKAQVALDAHIDAAVSFFRLLTEKERE